MPGIFGLAILAGMGFKHLINYNRVLNYAVKAFVIAVIIANLIQCFVQDKPYFTYVIGLKTRQQFLTQVIASDWWSVYDYNGEIKKMIGSVFFIVLIFLDYNRLNSKRKGQSIVLYPLIFFSLSV